MPKKKLIRNLFLIIGGFVLLLVVLAEVFKGDMVKMAIQKGAKTFDVPLSVGDVDFSLLYRFPLATIEFSDLVMLEQKVHDSLEIATDTSAYIAKLYASVDLVELMKGNILVKKVKIEDVKARYLVDSLGRSNFDFLMDEVAADTLESVEDTSKVQGVYTLDKLTLENIELEYVDELMHASANVHITELEMKGSVEPVGFKAATEGEVFVRELGYDNFNCEDLVNSKLNFSLTALNDSVRISDFTLNTGGALISLSGHVISKDSTMMDITFDGSDIDIAKNLSILPSQMMEDLKIVGATGMIHFKGSARGFLTAYTMPQIDVNVLVNDGGLQYDTYPSVSHIQMDANFSNGYVAKMESSLVNLRSFHAETEKSSVDLSAKILDPLKPQYDISGSVAIDLGEWEAFMPDSLVKGVSGRLKASVSTAGVLPDSITDEFSEYLLQRTRLQLQLDRVGFQMDAIPQIIGLGGVLNYSPQNIQLSALKIQVPDYHVNITNGYLKGAWLGKISDYENMSLRLDSLLVATAHSSIWASGMVDGLKNINYDMNSGLSVNLADIYPMLPDSLAYGMSGELKADLISSGGFMVDSLSDVSMALFFENSKLAIRMKDVSMDMQDTLLNVQNLSGNVIYHNDSLWMDRVSGSYLGLDFGADSTFVSHVYTGAVQNNKKEVRVHGNFEVGDMDYDWVEAFMVDTVPEPEELTQAKMQAASEEAPYVQYYTIKANGHMKARSFKYGDILLENMDAKFLADLDNNLFVADDLTCEVFDGQVNGALRYRMVDLPTDTVLRDIMDFRIDAESLDVSKMVAGLHEYIQEYEISDDNVKGFLSSELNGRMVLENYEPVFDSLMISGDLTLQEGALIGVKAITELQDLPGIGIKNLDNLRFKTLSSSLFIYRNNIFLPKTDIYSSSFEASLLGMYSFSGDYDFHIRAILSQILSGKVTKPSKEEQKGGFDSDDKGRYYVTSYLDGKSKAWFDNVNDRERMITRIRMNKRGLQVLFKPVLVRYETDVK